MTPLTDFPRMGLKRWARRTAPVLAGAAVVVLGPWASLVAVASTTTTTSPTTTTSTTTPAAPSLSLNGHGWGHGIGLGQWGALGYALQGQTYQWIVGHYYGGTSLASTPDSNIRVRLVANDGKDVIVTSASAFTAAGMAVAAGHAVLMHLASTGSWTVSTGPGCGGPWTPAGTASDSQAMSNGAQGGASPTLAATTPAQALAVPSATSPTASSSQLLQLCTPNSPLYVRGELEGAEINGSERTVNILPLESYLQGVVPSESPAYWGSLGSSGAQGQPQGFQALEAQAIAARSYAIADEETPSGQGGTGEYGYADICDTTACQVYGGMGAESATANQAVTGTAGQIVTTSTGAAAYAEFSSSTGGWTAGGAFPSVVDAGDAVCVPSACNPNHNWQTKIPISSIQSAYPSIGTYQSISVTARTGPSTADMGGRVSELTIQGNSGSVSVTGNTFASVFGLKSNWFAVTGVPSGGVDGYWAEGNDGGIFTFGAAQFYGSTGATKLNKPIVGMAATPDGNGYWLVARDGGIFTFGDAQFYGSTGAERLNQPVVGMASTPDGRGYWLVASDGGIFTFGDAHFYGSTGAIRLNQPIEGMAPTADGKGYWLVAYDGGMFNFGDAKFYGSTGGTTLPSSIVGMAESAGGNGYWLLEGAGTVHAFGHAVGYGSPSLSSSNPAVAITATADGGGYLIASRNGNVYSFGNAPNYGGVPSQDPGWPGALLDLSARAGS
jgi:SpoIID/LytB domain protein